MNRPVAEFYYTEKLPARAVPIARIEAEPSTPEELTDLNNLPQTQAATRAGSLVVSTYPVVRSFDAKIPGNPVKVYNPTGTPHYKRFIVENPFFEITDQTDDTGAPLFYRHLLPPGVKDVSILNAAGERVTPAYKVAESALYHSFDRNLYWVRYYDDRNLRTEMVRYTPVYQQAPKPSATAYKFESGVIDMEVSKPYWVRFTDTNAYSLRHPYNVLPNEPWYVRVRSNIRPLAPEWGRQLFLPFRPYMLATWVPATILSTNVIEFERRPIYFDGARYPDVLIFSQDYELKYAIDGSPVNTPARRGYLYPWKRSQVREMDAYTGRLHLETPMAPTDRVFGFYYYQEPDIIYRDLDVNPFSNPAVKNKIIEFVHNSALSPFRSIYHRVFDGPGQYNASLSNIGIDEGTAIGTVTVGGSVSLNELAFEDNRSRGGGLDIPYWNLTQADNLFDLGYWDGRPLPLGGSKVVYLPKSILKPDGLFTRPEVQAMVEAAMPSGSVPIVRFYDGTGEEQ